MTLCNRNPRNSPNEGKLGHSDGDREIIEFLWKEFHNHGR